MKYVIENVGAFLELNGFTREDNTWSNTECTVYVSESGYEIINNKGDSMFSYDFNIYWLIGCLTYCGYMDKNYKQLN